MAAPADPPTLAAMTAQHVTPRVEVSFVGTPPVRQIERATGVSDVSADGPVVRCLVAGSFQPFLEALRGHEVLTLRSIPTAATPDRLPFWRLNLLRVGYFILGVGLAVYKWPLLLHARQWTLMEGVVNCMLVALSLLAFVGLRYPVKMLPLLLFESAWKLIWLTIVALPASLSGQMNADMWESTKSCLWVVIILAVVPWRYVYSEFAVWTRAGSR
jgi:hypothetical protein